MIPKLTGNLLRAGRALAGLTRDDLAARTGLSRDVFALLGDQQRGHRPGGNPLTLVPRGRRARGRECAVQRRWGQRIIRRLTRLSSGSGTPSINSER